MRENIHATARDGTGRACTDLGEPMKKFRCGDVVPGCTASFTGSESDILREVTEHARVDHEMAIVPDALVGQVSAALVDA